MEDISSVFTQRWHRTPETTGAMCKTRNRIQALDRLPFAVLPLHEVSTQFSVFFGQEVVEIQALLSRDLVGNKICLDIVNILGEQVLFQFLFD